MLRLQVLHIPSNDTVLRSLMPGFSKGNRLSLCAKLVSPDHLISFRIFFHWTRCHLPQRVLLIIPYRSIPLVAARRGRVRHAGTVIILSKVTKSTSPSVHLGASLSSLHNICYSTLTPSIAISLPRMTHHHKSIGDRIHCRAYDPTFAVCSEGTVSFLSLGLSCASPADGGASWGAFALSSRPSPGRLPRSSARFPLPRLLPHDSPRRWRWWLPNNIVDNGRHRHGRFCRPSCRVARPSNHRDKRPRARRPRTPRSRAAQSRRPSRVGQTRRRIASWCALDSAPADAAPWPRWQCRH